MTLSRPAMLAVVAALAPLQAATAAAYCVYNKSTHFDALVTVRAPAGSPEAGRILPVSRVRPGESMCCSAADRNCLPATSSTHIEVQVSAIAAGQRTPHSCGAPGVALPVRMPATGYLLLRQSRAAAGAPDGSALALDVMEIDGRLIRTLPCASADRPTGGAR